MKEDTMTIIWLVAALFTTLVFIPKAIKTWKTKHTKDLSLIMLVIQFVGLITWFVYGFFRKDVPVLASNTISVGIVALLIIAKSVLDSAKLNFYLQKKLLRNKELFFVKDYMIYQK